MTKREYIKPDMQVFSLEEGDILTASLADPLELGLDDEWEDDE